MNVQENTQTPSEVVAHRTMERFVDKKLLTEELAAEIAAKVGKGQMHPADWKLIFEKSLNLHKAD